MIELWTLYRAEKVKKKPIIFRYKVRFFWLLDFRGNHKTLDKQLKKSKSLMRYYAVLNMVYYTIKNME